MNPGISELPLEQRIRLVEELWDSIAAEQGSLSLSDAQREELERRLAAFTQDGETGRDAQSVLAGIRQRL